MSNLNFSHRIESFHIKNNYFVGHILYWWILYLSKLEFNDFFFLQPKNYWKISKMKFDIKIKFYKSLGIDNLIDKKDGGTQVNFLLKFSIRHLCYLFFSLQFSFFQFNSPLQKKKNMQLNSILVLQWLDCEKKNLMTKLIFFLNYIIIIHLKMQDGAVKTPHILALYKCVIHYEIWND